MTSADTKFIPGHGPISTPGHVRKFIDMMKETRELVSAALKSGKNVDEIKKDKVLAAFDQFGKGFIKADGWIDALSADLQGKKAE